jgi:hypothetical protein
MIWSEKELIKKLGYIAQIEWILRFSRLRIQQTQQEECKGTYLLSLYIQIIFTCLKRAHRGTQNIYLTKQREKRPSVTALPLFQIQQELFLIQVFYSNPSPCQLFLTNQVATVKVKQSLCLTN